MAHKNKLLIYAGMLFFFTEGYSKTVLIYGANTGWIGSKMVTIFSEKGYRVFSGNSRLEDRESVFKEIDAISPDYVLNCAGKTGTPNVDWCEDHKIETALSNIVGIVNLVDATHSKGIHLTNFGSGCIYTYDSLHKPYESLFAEDEEPNFWGSFYSLTKVVAEKYMIQFEHVLNLRLRMPISSDLHPKNLITKLSKYKKLVNIPNSVSILDDLLPLLPYMVESKIVGIYNFVNPGYLTHNQIMDLYIKYVDNNHTYENFSIEDHNKILKAPRSACTLDASKLLKIFPNIPSARDSIEKVFIKISESLS